MWGTWFSLSSVLYCIIHVRLLRGLVGSVFLSTSLLLEKCAVTATHHWLAQGWLNACDTRVEQLLRLLRNVSDWPIYNTCNRSIIEACFEQFSCHSNKLFQVSCTLILPGCSNKHCFGSFGCVTVASNYSCWPNIDHFLQYVYNTHTHCVCVEVMAFIGCCVSNVLNSCNLPVLVLLCAI